VTSFWLGRLWPGQPSLEPLLVAPPALAAISRGPVRRPLICGGICLVAATGFASRTLGAMPLLPAATVMAVVVVTAISMAWTVHAMRKDQRLADVMSVAQAAQNALLRPPPGRVGPLALNALYLAAAAGAQVGGDLYEVARTRYGIRLIMGDVRGKGLDAVEVAADVLGVFRDVAHEVATLEEVAHRLDASLTRREAMEEEFVTAVLVEINPEACGVKIYNCGHPPPILLTCGGHESPGPQVMPGGPADAGGSRGDASPRTVIALEVPAPAPPLGLLTLADCSSAVTTVALQQGYELLLYTDGVTEARNPDRTFYPLTERLARLCAASSGGSGSELLDRLRADLLGYVGAPLSDDAAFLLVRDVGMPPGQTPPQRELAAQ
jgi:serine phosphatase RsbU (regulator of sigma subunit)